MSVRSIAKIAHDSTEGVGASDIPNDTFVLGESVFIRTVTYACLGKLVRISSCGPVVFLHLETAAYCAESDRFYDGLKNGTVRDAEPIIGEFRVSVASIVDVCQWGHKLITKQTYKG